MVRCFLCFFGRKFASGFMNEESRIERSMINGTANLLIVVPMRMEERFSRRTNAFLRLANIVAVDGELEVG